MRIALGIRMLPVRVVLLMGLTVTLSSCMFSDVPLWQWANPTMKGGETKQVNDGSFAPKRALNADYTSYLLDKRALRAAPGAMLRIVPIGEKDSSNNGLYRVIAFGVATTGEVFLIGRHGQVAPWLPSVLGEPLAVAVSLPARLLAIADVKGVQLVDLVTGEVKSRLTRIKTRTNSLDFDQAGESLLIGGTDSRVYRWKFLQEGEGATLKKREQALERYIGHTAIVSQVRFHPKGRVFFSADWSGKVSAWTRYDADAFEGEFLTNAMTGRPFTAETVRVKAAFQGSGNIEAIECSGDGELLAVASDEGQLSLLLVRGFKPLVAIQGHRGLIYDMGFRQSGGEIVTVGRDERLRLWRIDGLDLNSFDPTTAHLTMLAELVLPGVRRVGIAEDGTIVAAFKSGELQVLQREGLPMIVVPETKS